MNQRFAHLREPVLVTLLVFLVASVPLGWLVMRLHHEAAQRDGDRLDELARASYKAVLSDRVKHQVMLQTWRERLVDGSTVFDATAWRRVFEGSASRVLGRFRSVGYAQWTNDNKLEVRFIKATSDTEALPIGTELTRLPAMAEAIANEPKDSWRQTFKGQPIMLPGIGERIFALSSLQLNPTERGVLFATVVPEDFLTPIRTPFIKLNTDGSRGAEFVQEENLPGVGEGILRIESLSKEAWDRAHDEHPTPITFGLHGQLGDLHLVFRPGPNFARDSLMNEPWMVLGMGLLVALLLAVLAWRQARQSDVLRREVMKQTALLRETHDELIRFKAIAETTSDFVGMCELDGTPIYVNQAGRALLGIAPDEPIQLFEFERIYPPQTMALFESEGFAHAMQKGPWSSDLDLRHRDGHDIPVSFVGFVVKAPDGRPLHMGSMARDIRTRRQLDLQLREALEHERELVRLKSQFVNTVSHEFRTPLGVILTSADILANYLDRLLPEARREHLRDISASSKQMAAMLESVLDLGRIEAGKLACTPLPLELGALLHRITDECLSASNGGEVLLILDGDLEGAHGDEALLRHIFLNLLSNARKYSPPNTAVEFKVKRDGMDAIFSVRDHGIGIPAADVAGLFEAFARGTNVGDTPGTGLGLAIVKRSTELHGGSIYITSETGSGTLATVRLPLFPHQP